MKDDNFFSDVFKAKGAVIEQVPPTVFPNPKVQTSTPNFFAQEPAKSDKPMVFPMSEEAKKTMKPADVVSKTFEPELPRGMGVSILVEQMIAAKSGKPIPFKDWTGEAKESFIKETSDLAMGFVNPEKQVAETLVKDIAKSKSAIEITDILKSVYKNVSDDIIKPMAEKLAGITEPKLVNKELQVIRDVGMTTGSKLGEVALKSKSVEEFINNPETKKLTTATTPDALYHSTSFENAYDILNTGKLEPRVPKGEEAPGKVPSISLSRTKEGSKYVKDDISIVFNERELSGKLGKSKPFSYGGFREEAEQRYLGKEINNKLIKRIEVNSDGANPATLQKIQDIKDLAQEKGIPFFDTGKIGLEDFYNKVQESKNNLPEITASITKPSEPIITPVETQQILTGEKKIKLDEPFKLKNIITNVREYVEDNWIRIKNLERDPNAIIDPNTITPYQAEQLYHGRRATRLELAAKKTDELNSRIVATSKEFEATAPDFRADLNEYMRSVHAPERNAVHGEAAAGITDAQAKANLDRIINTPYYAKIQEFADEIKAINRETLDILESGGLLKQDDYNTLVNTYKNHVPLQRVVEDTDNISDVLTGRGFGAKSSGLKRASGSELAVEDILTNVKLNAQAAIERVEKNRVGLNILKFARKNKNLDMFEIIKPKAEGFGFDGKTPIIQKLEGMDLVPVRENGKQLYIKVKDKRLAEAYRNLNNDKLPSLLQWIGAYSRFMSGLATRFNPDFALPNKIRDLQEVMITLAADKNMGASGVKSVLGKEKQSILDVFDYVRGTKSEGAALYEQMKLDGGTTGGMSLSTREEITTEFSALKGKPRQAAEWVINKLDDMNTIFEDSTRLSVYKASLEKGLSREEAALNAKNASINFNKKGTGGPTINALWMFSNVSVQGSAKMMRAMKDPKIAAAVTASVAVPTFAINEWNSSVDPNWRDKVKKTDRSNGLPIMIPAKDGATYVVIPISWGIKPIKVGTDLIYDLATGQAQDAGTAVQDITGAILNGYNPLGGTDLMSAITPTILDLPVEIARNKTYAGSMIKPDYNKDQPATAKYFESLKDTAQGQASIAATEQLYKLGIEISPADLNYGLTQLEGGSGRFISNTVNTLKSIGKGELPNPKTAPFLNRFFKSSTEEEIQATSFYGSISQINREAARKDYEDGLKADKIAEKALLDYQMKGEEAAIKVLQDTPPELQDKVEQAIAEIKSGMTPMDRAIKNMGVANGARAKWIKLQLQSKKTDQDKLNFLEGLDAKGLISDEVYEQLSE